jgi:hypothetical protein
VTENGHPGSSLHHLQAAQKGQKQSTADVLLPVLTADDLPPDPVTAGEEGKESKGTQIQDAATPEANAEKSTESQEDKSKGTQEVKDFTLTEDMKGRLLHFTVDGDVSELPRGRALKVAFGNDRGIVFVDHVRPSLMLVVLKRSSCTGQRSPGASTALKSELPPVLPVICLCSACAFARADCMQFCTALPSRHCEGGLCVGNRRVVQGCRQAERQGQCKGAACSMR